MVHRKKASRRLSAQSRNPNPRDIAKLENDLFSEASNLSAAAGVRVAVITRRPSGEVRSWGSPSLQAVLSEHRLYSRRQFPAALASKELKGTIDLNRTAEEQNAMERELALEILGFQIERVQKRMRELAAVHGEAHSPAPSFHAEPGA